MKIDTSHVEAMPTLEVESYLRQHGYKVETNGIRIVQSDSNADKAYIAKRIETTAVPFEEADVTADSFETVICSCPACRFQSMPDLSSKPFAKFRPCKHAQVFREERAKQDDNQATL